MAGEKYTNIGKARWENANVGVIKWDPENKAGLASVIDETTGTVYEIGGGGGGGESDFSVAEMQVEVAQNTPDTLLYVAVANNEVNRAEAGILLEESATYNVILYKGAAFMSIEAVEPVKINIEGDIEEDQSGDYIITGDCVFSIRPEED